MKRFIHTIIVITMVLQGVTPVFASTSASSTSSANEQTTLEPTSTVSDTTPTDSPLNSEATPTGTEVSPTGTETSTATEAAMTETPTPEPSPTVFPTPESSPTILPTLEPSPTTTVTPTANSELVYPEQILLSTNPEYVNPGGVFHLRWQIADSSSIPADSKLAIYLPFGVELLDSLEVKLNEDYQLIQIPLNENIPVNLDTLSEQPVETQTVIDMDVLPPVETDQSLQGTQPELAVTDNKPPMEETLQPGKVIEGSIKLQVKADLYDTIYIAAEIQSGEHVSSAQTIAIPNRQEFKMLKNGGEISSFGGKLKILFPEEAASEDLDLTVNTPQDVQKYSGKIDRPFEITARSTSNKSEVQKFNQEIILIYQYDTENLSVAEEDLTLSYFDELLQDWQPLPSIVDIETHTIKTFTDHFTVFTLNVNDYQTSHLPTVDSFQVSTFTGAGTYNYPIQLPEGPGGQKPSVNLSYNSQVVDQATRYTQAAWVGMGWSLDTPAIERNMNGTASEHNDTFILSMDGISGLLVPFAGTPGYYHTADESFYRIKFDSVLDTWEIWDKTGNQYFFEGNQDYKKAETCGPSGDPNGMKYSTITTRWSLTRIRDIYGNEITYTYQREIGTISFHACAGTNSHIHPVLAVYPDTITYANNRYRVKFERTADRLDYVPSWAGTGKQIAFLNSRLMDIRVEQDADGDGTFEGLVRKYTFNYETDLSKQVMPGLDWGATGVDDWRDHTLTLKSVQEFGADGVTSLPALELEYSDGLHLTKVINGYGGSVEFQYEGWYYANVDNTQDSTVEDRRVKHIFGNGYFCNYNKSSGSQGDVRDWIAYPSSTSHVKCYSNALWVLGSPWYSEGTGYNTRWFRDLYKPGNSYRATANGGPTTYSPIGTYIKLGYDDGISLKQSESTSITGGTIRKDYIFTLNASATKLDPTIVSDSVRIYEYELEMLPTFYRVINKTVSDGQGNEYDYTYDYEGAAVNDSDHSEWVDTTSPLVKKYSEFRGHSQVTEHAPGGRTTVNSFEQGDQLKGRVTQVDVKDATNHRFSQTLNTYNTIDIQQGYTNGTDMFITWVQTTSVEQRSYNGDATYTATKESYEYDSTYGNVTGTTNSYWDGAAWVDFRKQITLYYPNTIDWLVSLPAGNELYSCPNGTCNTLESASYNLYDANSTHNTSPTTGILKAQRTWVKDADYSQVSYDYDSWGNQISITTWSGYGTLTTAPTSGTRTTSTAYDSTYHTYPVSSTDPLNYTTGWTYDYTLGVPLTETDINSNVTSAGYDSFGRLTTLTRPLDSSPTITIAYHDGDPFYTTATQRIDGTQNFSVRQTYDGLGRKIETRTLNASVLVNGNVITSDIVTDYTYNAYGQVTAQSTPHASGESSYTTTTSYDILGRPLTVTQPDGTSVSYAYEDFTTSVTDALNRTTTNTLDVLGRTISVTPPTGPGVSYAYDAKDQLTQAVYGSAVTSIQYDRAGRKLSMQDADMGSWSYAYDALGNLNNQTDARGCTTALAYDNLNRLTGKSYGTGCPATPAVTFTYDQNNQLGYRTSMSDGSGSTAWTYDARGRVTEETKIIQGQSFTTGWGYNSADLPVSMTYPDYEVVNSTYLPQMALNTLTGTDNYITASQYDSAGRLRNQAFGNGVTQTRSYNAWNTSGGRLQNMTSGTLQNLTYSYDSVGNITSITDPLAGPQIQSFTYDTLDRLTSADAVGGLNGLYSETYGYDSTTGNLASKGGNTYTYGDTSHIHAVTGLSNGNAYTYDANGNQVTRVIGTDTYSLTYDAENRLTAVLKNGQPLASFTYDSDGVQVAATVNGVTTRYVGGIYEVEGTNVTKYYLAGMNRIAMRSNGVLNYLLQDHLGSTALVTDNLGNLVSEKRYKAWGETRYSSSAANTDYLYTGQREVADIGLYFYKARWYDSTLGRFNQPDPIIPENSQGIQAWNRYTYVNNSPVNFDDPSGHCAILCTALIGGAIGGIVGGVGYAIYTGVTGNEFNIGHFLLAVGGGALAGTLIGTGVGFAAGMSEAAATTAAITGAEVATTATTTVLTATGGNPSDEITSASQAFGNLSQAANYGVQQGAQLKNAIINTGLQTHHIIEQRLASALGQTAAQARQWLSVAVTPQEHQAITNAWRSAIGYTNSSNPINTLTATVNDVWLAAQRIYFNHPALLDAVKNNLNIPQ